ncbi:hypothetical protein [Dechloromonas sp. HYN0024]|uniref:hypothetical protein n=1 Tax=Dechloromonas sp. HYN0024 TaxID=2231055 RepID=UPI0013C2AC84|nr:hypothetical protein [Dechloromonas sp. HYN0024]
MLADIGTISASQKLPGGLAQPDSKPEGTARALLAIDTDIPARCFHRTLAQGKAESEQMLSQMKARWKKRQIHTRQHCSTFEQLLIK